MRKGRLVKRKVDDVGLVVRDGGFETGVHFFQGFAKMGSEAVGGGFVEGVFEKGFYKNPIQTVLSDHSDKRPVANPKGGFETSFVSLVGIG